MFGLFKSKKQTETKQTETLESFKPQKPKDRSIQEVVKEIHETFFTEVDRLLAEAKVTVSTESLLEKEMAKASELESLGFRSTKHTTNVESERMRLSMLKQVNDKKVKLKKAIEYFSEKYPLYRFITIDSVERICEKYGLVYGPVSEYIGEVPDKNLKEISQFQKVIKDTDKACYYRHYDLKDCANFRYGRSALPMYIAAPRTDFKKSSRIEGRKIHIEIPDPIVLQPVFHDNRCSTGEAYFLVVSAWGPEAGDPDVVNPINN